MTEESSTRCWHSLSLKKKSEVTINFIKIVYLHRVRIGICGEEFFCVRCMELALVYAVQL